MVGVPESRAAIQACRQDHQSVRAELGAHYHVAVFEVREDFPAAAHFPHTGVTIRTRRHYLSVVWTKRGPVDPTAVSQRGSESFASYRVPDLCGTITAGGDNKPAVVAECGIQHRVCMASKLLFHLPGGKIPETGDVVPARSDDSRSVGTENCAENRVRMQQC